MCSVHINTNLPSTTFDVVMFCLFQIAFNIKLLCQVLMSILEQIFSELGNKPDHVIILLCLSVDVNSKIWLVCCQVHSLRILVVTFLFKLSSFLDIEHCVLLLWKVSWDYLIRLIPFVCSNVHFKCLYELTSVHIVLLGEIELSYFRVMLGNLLVVWSSNLWWLVCYQLDCSVPFSCVQGCFNCFIEDTGLNIMLNGKIQLLLAD